jgi:2-isopropylmalate synthase
MGPVKLIDCTLREGMQAPGVRFSAAQSRDIARLLVACGVEMIECGHPAVSTEEGQRVQATIAAAEPTPVLCHARARHEDIDAAAATGAQWVGIFLGCNDITRRARVTGASADDLLSMIDTSVRYAVRRGLRVRFTVEDASRTERAMLERAYMTAVTAGADRICFADSVGVLEPADATAAAQWLSATFPGIDSEFHLHDDRGLATANALAAIDAGASWISCSVNGIGERSGVTGTFLLMTNLHHRGLRQLVDAAASRRLSALVSAVSGTPVDPLRPVIGRNAFTHTSALHQRAARRDPLAYSWIDPAVIGARTAYARSIDGPVADLLIKSVSGNAVGGDPVTFGTDSILGYQQRFTVQRVHADTSPLRPLEWRGGDVDRLCLLVGVAADCTGLKVSVKAGNEETIIASPCTVFLPAVHPDAVLRVLDGEGLLVTIEPAIEHTVDSSGIG